jgi:hypothetical protein
MRFDEAVGRLDSQRVDAWAAPLKWSRLRLLSGRPAPWRPEWGTAPPPPDQGLASRLRPGEARAFEWPNGPASRVIWSAVLSAQGDASPKSLFDAVLNSVKAAEAAKIRSIAFPPLAAPTMPEDEAVGTICEALRMTDSFVRAVVVRPR